MTTLTNIRPRRPAFSRHGRRLAVLRVEELEARQVLATVTSLGAGALPAVAQGTSPAVVSQPAATQANGGVTGPNAVPATTTTSPTGSTVLLPGITQGTANGPDNGLGVNGTATTGPFLFTDPRGINAQGQPSVTLLAGVPQPGNLAVTTATAGVVTPDMANQLPPILQGASLVTPTGPLTFAQLQRITTDFIGGGHTEPPLLARPASGFGLRPTPSPEAPVPTPAAAPESVAVVDTPRHRAPVVPLFALPENDFAPGADESRESQNLEEAPAADDGVWMRMELPAVPLLAATLAAHWADQRRLRAEEGDDHHGSRSLAV